MCSNFRENILGRFLHDEHWFEIDNRLFKTEIQLFFEITMVINTTNFFNSTQMTLKHAFSLLNVTKINEF